MPQDIKYLSDVPIGTTIHIPVTYNGVTKDIPYRVQGYNEDSNVVLVCLVTNFDTYDEDTWQE